MISYKTVFELPRNLTMHDNMYIGTGRPRVGSTGVGPRASIDGGGSRPVNNEGRNSSFRSDKGPSSLLRGPINASGSDMTDDSISVVSAPPAPVGNR